MKVTTSFGTVKIVMLKGEKGDKFEFEDYTPEELESLRGEKGDAFTYDDFTEEQLTDLRSSVASAYYRKIDATYRTIGDNTETIPIPIEGYTSADMLLIDVEGLALAEGEDYTIDGSNIVLATPITHNYTAVNFRAIRAFAITTEDYDSLIGDLTTDMSVYVDEWMAEHPEATTTVQDGSITNAKLVQSGGILSEVMDIRTGVDSKIYDSAGVAVRGQINDINDKVENRITRVNFEDGGFEIVDGALSPLNSDWQKANVKRSTSIVKVPAYTQFFVTDDTFRGNVYTSTDGETFESHGSLYSGNRSFMPQVDSYVAFSFYALSGGNPPTAQQCHDGFYILYPFETKDYPDLTANGCMIAPDGKVNPQGRFIRASLTSGIPNLYSDRRVVFVDMFTAETDLSVTIETGFRAGFSTFENGVFASDSGWKYGTYNIPSGTQFKMIIARVTEQDETADNWWLDFIKAVTFEATEKPGAAPNISPNKPFMLSSRPKFALHRGMQSQAPENSAPAFRIAGQSKAWAIETDVYETSDGHLVCIHDSTVDRTTDGTGNVVDKTLAEIQALNIDVGINIDSYIDLKIPTFEEYLSICKTYGCVAFIEIKDVRNLQLLYDTVVQYGMLYSCVFIVWEGLLNSIRAIDTDAIVPCMLNGYSSAASYDAVLATAKKYPNVMLGLQRGDNLTDAIINEAHQNNIVVGTWTVNTQSDAIGFFGRGIDIVTTESLTDFS